MRKLFLGLAALMLSMTVLAERVSQEDAALVANNFMNVENTVSGVKKAPAKKMVLKKAATAAENQYYVYENANGEGWVMISANDIVRPVLAYSNTGRFRADNMPNNITKWLGKYDHFIQRLEADGVTAGEETATEWKALRKANKATQATPVVGPLVKTTWDQDEPFNNLCPGTGKWGSGSTKAATGCVATAMAQVMNYWQWPKKGTGSHTYQPLDPNSNTGAKSKRYGEQTANFGETTYDWDNMINDYSGSYTTAEGNAVATLMYHCGVASEMMYGNYADGGSGTYTVNYGDWEDYACAQSSLAAFFGYKKSTLTGYMRDGYTYQGTKYYDSWTDEAWTAMIKEELDKQHPIMYAGASSEGGHSFVCDGYDNAGYFHFNWGWSGSCDGYFLLSKLNPGGDGIGGGGYDFSEEQDVIIGIVPDKKDLPKVTITWSVDGEETTQEFTQEDALVLPANPADCESGKKFVGWTANPDVDGEKPSDLFTNAGSKTVYNPVTYYAVYATAESGSSTPSEVASVTFSTASSDGTSEVSNISSIVASANGIQSYSGSKVYKGKEGAKLGTGSANGSISLTLSASATVSKVVINASKYGSDAGTLTVTAGSTTIGTASQAVGSNMEFVASTPVEANTITITTNKRAYIASISVIAGGGTTYTEYAINCGAPAPKYAINITDVDHGSFTTSPATQAAAGRTVTITAAPSTNYHLTSVTVKDEDEATVAVSGSGKTYTFVMPAKAVTISGTFAEDDKYTVNFYNQSELISTKKYFKGETAVQPSAPAAECTAYTFAGWWTEALAADNTAAKPWITDFTVNGDQNYYAIFSKTVGGGGTTEIASVTFKTAESDSNSDNSSKIKAELVEEDNGIAAYSGSKLYLGKEGIKLGSSKSAGYITLELTNTVAVSAVKINASKYGSDTGNLVVSLGDEEIGEEAPAADLTFTASSPIETNEVKVETTSKRAYIASIVVISGNAGTTYYSSVVDCSATAIDNTVVAPKAIKVIENGQLVIILGNEKYTIFGQKIQ